VAAADWGWAAPAAGWGLAEVEAEEGLGWVAADWGSVAGLAVVEAVEVAEGEGLGWEAVSSADLKEDALGWVAADSGMVDTTRQQIRKRTRSSLSSQWYSYIARLLQMGRTCSW
jgi:hypothetical protein